MASSSDERRGRMFNRQSGHHDIEAASKRLNDDGTKHILVEIVSALNVPSMDARSDSDPFVTVFMGGEEVHRTQVLYNTPNPIWTIQTGSLFLLKIPHNFYGDPKVATVSFVLKDYDRLQTAKILGAVEVKIKTMLKGKGKRKEYSMDIPPNVLEYNKRRKRKIPKKAKLVLRFKRPSADEMQFIETLEDKKVGIFSHETYLPPTPSTAKSESGLPQIKGWGAKLLETAAGSTPDSPDTILEEAIKPSTEWIDVGSGKQGKVYVETIGCNDLPNMDSTTLMNVNNLTDPYCCLIMEDSIVHTSIIKDTQSPRWMSSDRRAFVFHVHHPSSQLFVGVFDHDKVNRPGVSLRKRVHDPMGRVLINLTQFHVNTLYTLHYHLYLVDNNSAKHREEQTHNGTLLVRIRIEWGDRCCNLKEQRNIVLAGMVPRPTFYLSIPNKYDFAAAHYTTEGEYDISTFNLKTLTGYVNELQTYVDDDVIDIVLEAILTVLLWRGHYHVRCCCCNLRLPIHSIVAFTWGILVTQNYNRFFSFLLFAVAWFFLATMEFRRSHPSPWQRCKSYTELLGTLLVGSGGCCCFKCAGGGQMIPANENLPEIQSYYAAVKERKDMRTEQKELAAQTAAEQAEGDLKLEVEGGYEAEEEVTIATTKKDSYFSSVNPLKPILHPVQKILHLVCVYLRIIKNIITWEENYIPFGFVTASLLASLLIFFVPWGWILRWGIRLAVWIFLGPWMKVVDWVYFGRREKLTPEEEKELRQEELHDRYKQTLAERLQSQKRKERAVKLRSMMKYMFGKYVLRVPRFREAQFLDYPLPASTAEPFQAGTEEVTTVGQVCGQTLTGDMIPSRMIQEHPFITETDKHEESIDVVQTKSEAVPDTPVPLDESKPLLPNRISEEKKRFGFFRSWKK